MKMLNFWFGESRFQGYNATIIEGSGNVWHTLLLCKI